MAAGLCTALDDKTLCMLQGCGVCVSMIFRSLIWKKNSNKSSNRIVVRTVNNIYGLSGQKQQPVKADFNFGEEALATLYNYYTNGIFYNMEHPHEEGETSLLTREMKISRIN